MRLVVPFKRNYLNLTKIWTLGSPKFRVNKAKIIVKGSRVNKVPVKFFSRTKSESLVSLIIFLVTGYPLNNLTSTVQWSGKGPYSLERAGNPTKQ